MNRVFQTNGQTMGKKSSEKQYILSSSEERVSNMGCPDIVDNETKTKGNNVFTSAALVMGEVAGSGILAMPYALECTGVIGIALMPFIAIVCAYTGGLLGRCWLLVQERHVEYRGHVRHPYPVIGLVAYGRWGRITISCLQDLCMFGAGVVMVILASQNVKDLLQQLFNVRLQFCFLIIIIAIAITPLVWLGSPKDFWMMGIGGAVTTTLASVLIFYLEVKDLLGPYRDTQVVHSKVELLPFFQGIAVFFFGFGGHPSFPAIQNDMKEPSKFDTVSFIGLSATLLVYFTSSVPGFLIYGSVLLPNVTLTISPSPILHVIQILITVHLICAFLIVVSPVVQELEELLNVNPKFSWTRVATRTSMMAATAFVALTVPKFSALLAFIGGSCMFLLSGCLPCLFYLKLNSMAGDWPKVVIPLHIKVLLLEIIVVGGLVGIMGSIGALKSMLAPESFSCPCYVNMTSAEESARLS